MGAPDRLRTLAASMEKTATIYLIQRITPCIEAFVDDVYKAMGAHPTRRGEAIWNDHEIKVIIGLGDKDFYCGVLYGPQDTRPVTVDNFWCGSMSYHEIARRTEKALTRFLETGQKAARAIG